MTLFSMTVRVALAALVLGLGACSSSEDLDLYGYEDEYAIPEPDLIPETPDDKPGRTVDEMLGVTVVPAVVKKRTDEAPAQSENVYEHSGRFGSKEKISLRKGLNVPESGIIYSDQKRKNAEEVRSLEVKEQEKNEQQTLMEEAFLAQIVKPREESVKIIEVVPLNREENEAEPYRLLPGTEHFESQGTSFSDLSVFPAAKTENANPKEIVLPVFPEKTQPADSQKQTEKTVAGAEEALKSSGQEAEKVALESKIAENAPQPAGEKAETEDKSELMRPLISQKAEPPVVQKVAEEEEIILLRRPVKSAKPAEETDGEDEVEQDETFTLYDGFVLVPPYRQSQEEYFVLKPPASYNVPPSVEVFLEEIR